MVFYLYKTLGAMGKTPCARSLAFSCFLTYNRAKINKVEEEKFVPFGGVIPQSFKKMLLSLITRLNFELLLCSFFSM